MALLIWLVVGVINASSIVVLRCKSLWMLVVKLGWPVKVSWGCITILIIHWIFLWKLLLQSIWWIVHWWLSTSCFCFTKILIKILAISYLVIRSLSWNLQASILLATKPLGASDICLTWSHLSFPRTLEMATAKLSLLSHLLSSFNLFFLFCCPVTDVLWCFLVSWIRGITTTKCTFVRDRQLYSVASRLRTITHIWIWFLIFLQKFHK